jgi:AcrR family transcriptional regulator
MKVSARQKAQIRRKLLETAAAMISERGFASVTMRDISTGAGFSPSTIYSYFPGKEKIFYAWFEEKQDEMFEAIEAIEDFESFDLKEKLQTVMEIQLDVWQKDRTFVATTFKALLDSPLRSFTEFGPVATRFSDEIGKYFEKSIERKEIPSQPFLRFLCHLVWDYRNLVTMYWLRDETVGCVNTSRLIDMSLDIFIDVLRSGMISKVADIGVFLFRSHFFGNLDKMIGLASLIGGLHTGVKTEEDGR